MILKNSMNIFIYFMHLSSDASLVVEEPDISESSSSAQKDELSEILGTDFNLESMVRETGTFFTYICF